jgi:hypothetical protein
MSDDQFAPLMYSFRFGAHNFGRRCEFSSRNSNDFFGQPFFCRYDRISAAFSRALSPELRDLIEIATCAYLADRFAPRRHPEKSNESRPRTRHMRLSLPVRSLEVWRGKPTKLLEDLLLFLSGERWEFEFLPLNDGYLNAQQSYLLDFFPDRQPAVMLSSGGLDSYAGAVHQLRDPDYFHVLLSGFTHNRMAADQADQADLLFDGRRKIGQRIAVAYGLPTKLEHIRLESSQRARGLVYLTIGAVAAVHLNLNQFSVYENGIGALNLPFDASQSGWEISRAVHPKTLFLMEQLISSITAHSFHIRTPFLFSTKADCLKGIEENSLRAGIARTFSCDRFPDYRERRRQCGVCSSCILRRLSLESAGLEVEPKDEYAQDITSEDFVPRPSGAFVLDKFDTQAHRIHSCFGSQNPWLEMVRLFPELHELEFILTKAGIDDQSLRSNLLSLYRKHVDEWRAFSGRAALNRYLNAA